MSTRDSEIRDAIVSEVMITRQHIAVAKSFILDEFSDNSRSLLRKFLEKYEASPPEKFIVNPQVPVDPQKNQAVKSITWQVAFCEALWSLIYHGLIFRVSEGFDGVTPHISWTTIYQRSGGSSSGWSFDEFGFQIPSRIRKAPSLESNEYSSLSDSDLYLTELGIGNIDLEVEEALRDAVKCFKHDLYVPSLAMLSKASEGAWTELGYSLLNYDLENSHLSQTKRDNIREEISSPYSSIAKKIRAVVELYDIQGVYKPLRKISNISPSMLKSVANWSDIVRDSRNAVHYGTEPSIPNSYEKVAVLLISAGQNLRMIYTLRQAAEDNL